MLLLSLASLSQYCGCLFNIFLSHFAVVVLRCRLVVEVKVGLGLLPLYHYKNGNQ